MRHILVAAFVVIAGSAEAQTTRQTVCSRHWDWSVSQYVTVCNSETSAPPPAPRAPEEPFSRGPGTAEDVYYSKEAEAMKPRHTDGKPLPCPAPWRWTANDGCQLARR